MPGPWFRNKSFQKVVPSQSNVVINYSRVYPPLFYNPLKINTKSKNPLKPFKTLYFWWLYKVIIPSRVDPFTGYTLLIINTIYIVTPKPFKTLYPCEVIKSSRLCYLCVYPDTQISSFPAWNTRRIIEASIHSFQRSVPATINQMPQPLKLFKRLYLARFSKFRVSSSSLISLTCLSRLIYP